MDVRHHPTVGRPELEFAALSALDLKVFFVNGSVVPATQQGEIGERGGAPLGPVLDVMGLAERKITAREAATVVAEGERSAHGCRNRACSRADLHDHAVGIVTHLHPVGITRQPLGRFRGNARAAVED